MLPTEVQYNAVFRAIIGVDVTYYTVRNDCHYSLYAYDDDDSDDQ